MAKSTPIENEVRACRLRLGWSQQELALRSGLSRTGVGAIESGVLVPSTAAALALAAALGCRVDDLFRLRGAEPSGPEWAWSPRSGSGRFWQAEVGGRTRLYPVEASPLGVIPHDGTYHAGVVDGAAGSDPSRTLVMACCDPAAGLLAGELARSAGIRLIVLGRSSRSALEMVGSGLAHVAGIHLARSGEVEGHERAVRETLGAGFSLLRVAEWEEGIAASPARKLTTVGGAMNQNLRWIGREVGSGSRQCLDELREGRPAPRRSASDHLGVVEAIRSGWADAGVCLRLAAEEAGLDFLGVRQESYDLCFSNALDRDPRIRALVNAVRSSAYRKTIGDLPGYDGSGAGALRLVV